jgi:hypothetical protein
MKAVVGRRTHIAIGIVVATTVCAIDIGGVAGSPTIHVVISDIRVVVSD